MKTSTVTVEKNIANKSKATALQQARDYIYSIDFSMIIEKLVKRHKWLRIEAEEACAQYRNYLWLLKKYGINKPLPPSKDIDEFWHHHILDTKKYATDCSVIFGTYLHHYPYYGDDKVSSQSDLNRSFLITQKLYQHEFGHIIESIEYRFKFILRFLYKINLIR